MGRLSALSATWRCRQRLLCTFAAAALLVGCATWAPDKCEQFERTRRSTDYDTVYVYSRAETQRADQTLARRPRRADPVVRWYTLRLNRSITHACEHLYLIKDLYLQRSGEALTIEEQREFYTAQGQLIATKRENITPQLPKTGYYTASVPLPIPRGAPAGTYRVVSRLIATPPAGRALTLATTTAEFRVEQ
jgi:hypothetical protein